AYVLAVSSSETVWLGEQQCSITTIVAELSKQGWERLSAGLGSKGQRTYDWRQVEVHDPVQQGWKRTLLLRSSINDTIAMTAYIVFAPVSSKLADQVRVAGMRWTVEESIQTAKGQVGLDHYEVRSWSGWYRHITLAMWAQAFLSVIREETGAEVAPKKG